MRILIAIILLVSLQQIQAGNWWLQVTAENLDQKTFEQNVGKDKHYVIEFFTPWCRYCQMLSQAWNQLDDHFKAKNQRKDVVIAKLNCEDNASFCGGHHVHSYPTIKIYQKNQSVADGQYQGNRTFPALLDWISDSVGEEEKVQEVKKQEQKQQQQQPKKEQKNEQNKEEQLMIDDSTTLLGEIKQSLQDGLQPSKKFQQQRHNFSQLNSQQKAEIVFDEIHQTKIEMEELNIINEKNLKLLKKTIEQADKLQDERIKITKEIQAIDQKIDDKKDQILQLASNSQGQQNLGQIEQKIQSEKQFHQDIQEKQHINMMYSLGLSVFGLLAGFSIAKLIQCLHNKKQGAQSEQDDKLY